MKSKNQPGGEPEDEDINTQELIIPLPSGYDLRCGPGEQHQWGGYVVLTDPLGNERYHWDMYEWAEDPEGVIGAIFAATAKVCRVPQTPMRCPKHAQDACECGYNDPVTVVDGDCPNCGGNR